MALADFLQALLKQPGGPQAALAQAASDQGSAGPNGSAAYQNALQAAFQAQGAPQMPAQSVSPMTTGSVAPQPQAAPPAVSAPAGGGGLGGLLTGLQDIFNPQARGRNATIQYLTNKGYDPGTAQIIAADKPLLRQALIGGTKVSDFDQRAQAARSYGLTPGTEDFRNFVLTGKIGDGLLPADVEAQKIRIARSSRPETNINLPGQPAIGSIPQGFAAKQDPATGQWTMYAVPGGPADTSKTDQATVAGQTTKTDVITDAYKKAHDLIGGSTTGLVGQGLGVIPPSDAAELRRQVAVLKANATIENLNAMRRQSQTGGALGNVTEKEGAMLASAAGALDPNASPQQFKSALDNYYRTLLRIVNGPEAGDKMFNDTNSSTSGSAPKQIKSEEDYALLPRGAQYVAPDGSIRRKR